MDCEKCGKQMDDMHRGTKEIPCYICNYCHGDKTECIKCGKGCFPYFIKGEKICLCGECKKR